ncbi:hypothetical protein TELCIR_04969 [Teladorsagia circumcincta]|uniref:Uncharacterized protein n=1 Tax=Teladorsagia circumcincta TaxID=45464 RepID=A0A2G9US71_TELCI|nr:hypothetical protein TELCIR_04969 [Teladorsagia circumcincta]
MKAMGHLSQIADLQVDTIQFTEDLISLEYEPDNSTLVIQAIAAAIVMFGASSQNEPRSDARHRPTC